MPLESVEAVRPRELRGLLYRAQPASELIRDRCGSGGAAPGLTYPEDLTVVLHLEQICPFLLGNESVPVGQSAFLPGAEVCPARYRPVVSAVEARVLSGWSLPQAVREVFQIVGVVSDIEGALRRFLGGRDDERDPFSLVAAIDREVFRVYGDHLMGGMEFAHTYDTEIRQVRLAVRVTFSERFEVHEVLFAVEGQARQPISDHSQHDANVLQMERGLRNDRLARERWGRYLLGNLDRPIVVLVVPVGKRDKKASIRDRLHDLEKPFLLARSLGPETLPARRM